MNLDGIMITKKKFSMLVEKEVLTKKLSYIDAIVHLCEQLNLEIEDIKKFISQSIELHLEEEAKQLNFIPKSNKLPLDI